MDVMLTGEHAQALSDALTAFLMNWTEQHVALLSAAVVIMGTILDSCGFFCPAIFNCFLSQLVKLQGECTEIGIIKNMLTRRKESDTYQATVRVDIAGVDRSR